MPQPAEPLGGKTRSRVTFGAVAILETLHRSERGDLPVGQILLIGIIVIPLVIFLVAFRAEIVIWFSENVMELYTTPEIKTAP